MEKLGIEPKLLFAQIVNFAIIVFVLSKLLYKPILGMLEKRKKEIAEGLQLTEKMKEEEEKFAQKKQKMFETTRKEAQEILEEARKQAKEEEKEILASAHKEAQLVIEKGKGDVVRSQQEMEKGVRNSAIDLAVAMSRKLLASMLTGEDKHKLLSKHIKELQERQIS